MEPLKQNPAGWTDQGCPPGWIRPQRTPQTGKLKKLEAENQALSERLARMEAAVERMMGDSR